MQDFVQEGDLLAEKYRVTRIVERGGMGVVVAARHVHLDRPVALKLLPPAAAEDLQAVGRFLREACAAAQIQSEHIVRVSDVGMLDSGAPYMEMELLEGMDLAKVLRAAGALPIATAVDYVLQVCEGVAEAHRLGIVHRDLKPSNVFLTERSDGSPLIKVLDFGISKLTGPSIAGSIAITTTAAFIGSPAYMSPEQVRSAKDVDTRTDLWSLGIVLQELLTGSPVFRADSAHAVMAMIAADPPAPARSLRPDIPVELEAVILKCLQKDRAHRYPSVAELAAALAPFGSSRGKVSAAHAAKILRLPVPEAALTTATQVSSEPPSPLTRSSREDTAHHAETRHTKFAGVAAMGGLAIAVTLGGLMFRRSSRPSGREVFVAVSPASSAPIAASVESESSKGPDASTVSRVQERPAEPSRAMNQAGTQSFAASAPAATGRAAASPARTSKPTGTLPAASAPPLASARPLASSMASPTASAPSPDSKTRVFDHRTF